MTALWITLAIAFVLLVLAFVAYGLFEMSPFAHHVEELRDVRTGRPSGDSPHLETRDEFEHSIRA
jgi:hypothetical protein